MLFNVFYIKGSLTFVFFVYLLHNMGTKIFHIFTITPLWFSLELLHLLYILCEID